MAIRFGALLFRIELLNRGVFENMAIVAVDLFRQCETKFERMKFCLVGEAHTRRPHERNLVEICCVESEFIRELCILP